MSPEMLFNNLMKLCEEENSPFYFKDFSLDSNSIHRIFNYRLASYTDFLKPGALECRGSMFMLDPDGKYITISCRPPRKFFNLNENPFTMNVDFSRVIAIMDKADGSLISSFYHHTDKTVRLKSKGSLFSEQVVWATDLLNSPDYEDLKNAINEYALLGYTVNMEYVSPKNRVVLPYQKDELKVFSVVDNMTGETFYKDDISHYSLNVTPHSLKDRVLLKYWVDTYPVSEIEDMEKYVKELSSRTGIEGVVLLLKKEDRTASRQLIKHKTDWYLSLHKTKDSIVIPRRLFECVIDEATDDLRSMFHDDPAAIQMIEDMEQKVIPKYSSIVNSVENFYEQNKDLSRKDYAIKGTKELEGTFSLAMTKYLFEKGLGRNEPDFKEFAKKNYKMFGVKDEEVKGSDD